MSYTVVNTSAGGQDVTILRPDAYAGAPTPLVVFHHGAGQVSGDMLDGAGIQGVVERLANDGYLVADSTASGDAWGNDDALADYDALQGYMETNYNVSQNGMVAVSMGAISAHLMVGGVNALKGILGIYPACDLDNMHTVLGASIDAAYPSGYSGHNPIALAASTYAGLRIRYYASPADTTVSKVANADAMAAHVAAQAKENQIVCCRGNHADAFAFPPADAAAFFGRCFGPAATSVARGRTAYVI